MVIDLKKYFQGQQDTLRYELDLSGLELGGVKPFCAPVKVEALCRGFAGSVLLELHARYTVSMPCDRCCQTVTQEWERNFSHTVVRQLSDEQDDDSYVVAPEERLDLDELVREDILLDMPTKFLCAPDCKGLCPKCGKNLNQGPCGCGDREIDPRLAVLKELLEP